MKKLWAGMRLDAFVYLKSGFLILPALALITLLGVLYAIVPVDAVGSACLSGCALFYIGAALGLSYAWSENAMFAQTLSVKLGYGRHMAAQALFLALCALCMGLLAVAYPLLMSCLRPGFASRPIGADDALSALALNALLALNGAALGALFHPRVFPDRKLAFVLCLLLALMGLAQRFMGVPGWIAWIFPPVYDAVAPFSGKDVFAARDVGAAALRLLAYAAVLIAARQALLLKNRY